MKYRRNPRKCVWAGNTVEEHKSFVRPILLQSWVKNVPVAHQTAASSAPLGSTGRTVALHLLIFFGDRIWGARKISAQIHSFPFFPFPFPVPFPFPFALLWPKSSHTLDTPRRYTLFTRFSCRETSIGWQLYSWGCEMGSNAVHKPQ